MKTWWKNFLIRMLVRRKWLRAIVDEFGKRISSLINNSLTRVKSWWAKIPRFTTPFVVGFVGLVWLINQTTETVVPEIKSVPHEYWLWGLGVLAGSLLLWFAVKNSTVRKGASKFVKNKWLLLPVAIVLLIATYHKIPDYFPDGFVNSRDSLTQKYVIVPSKETTFIVTVGSEWSKVYRYPRDMATVDHRGIGPSGRFAMMTESGIYNFSPEKSDVVRGSVPWARFKSLTDSEERVKVTLY